LTLPQSSADAVGSLAVKFRATRLNIAGLILLFMNGVFKETGLPPLQAGDVNAVKSPASIAAVGIVATCSDGSWRNNRSEDHTSELQSHSFISYAVFCLKKKKQ